MKKSERLEIELDQQLPVAERIVQWFELLVKLRQAADEGVNPDELIGALKQADLELLNHDYCELMNLVQNRFVLGNADVDKLIQLDKVRPVPQCPYTAAQYDSAVEVAGKKQGGIANELGVTRKTLRKWGRPEQ